MYKLYIYIRLQIDEYLNTFARDQFRLTDTYVYHIPNISLMSNWLAVK